MGNIKMIPVILTRRQFETVRDIFDSNIQLKCIKLIQESSSGIGPNLSVEFDPTGPIKIDITDVDSW